jgi:hypothetical protein
MNTIIFWLKVVRISVTVLSAATRVVLAARLG